MDRRRKHALAAVVGLCLGLGVAYVIVAALDAGTATTGVRPAATSSARSALASTDLLVRAVDPSEPRLNGRVYRVADGRPDDDDGDGLACQRVYFAAGRGLCLALSAPGVDYEAIVFDAALKARARFTLTGLPSRARVSPDGRYGATTVFVSGHAYTGGGGVSTTTTIVDMRSGKQLAELEQFDVLREGRRFDSVDFNFWGVTFRHDSNRFYATLHTGDQYYLVEGDLRAREMTVLQDGVECPSLSPDGTRIAFKSRIGSADRWRLRVLDLATLSDHPVAERRSIDDQVEWLDNRTLAYSDGVDVFTVPAGGGGAPQRVLRDAASPAVLRGGGSGPTSSSG